MKLFKLCTLSAAVLAATAGAAQANSFIDDSTVDVKVRGAHFDYKPGTSIKQEEGNEVEEGKNLADQYKQTALGAELNFKSGYFADVVGFDASLYGALKVSNSGGDNNKGNGQLLGEDGKSYHKLGQAYLKAKFGDDNLDFYGQAGYMRGKNGLILGSTSRSTPASYRGALAEMTIQDFWVHAGYVDRVGRRTETSWDQFKNKNGDIISNAWQLGGRYNANNISAELTYLQSKSYAKQLALVAGYDMDVNDDVNVQLEGVYFQNKKGGDLWDKDGNTAFDNKGSIYNLGATVNYQGFAVGLIYAKSKADLTGTIGTGDDEVDLSHKIGMVSDSAGIGYGASPSRVGGLISDFNSNGESVWKLHGSYDYANVGVPGLMTSLSYTRGSGAKSTSKQREMSENETQLVASYAFQQEQLKGLSLKLKKAWHTSEEKADIVQAKETTKSESLRFYVDYTVSIF